MFLFRSPAEPQTRPTGATEAGIGRVVQAIQSAARATGAGFDYLLRTAHRESSLQPAAQAPTSSARGLYQFIDSTWLTMVRDEGRKLGLERYAQQIGTNSAGQPVVADPAARREILALRDDPQISALMAGAFTNRNAQDLRAATGRNPTEGELYMAHFLGSGGAARLITMNQSNPQGVAARAFPDAASANRAIFFENGRPRTVAEVYAALSASGASEVRPAATLVAAQAVGQTTGVAAAGQDATNADGGESDSGRGSWSAVPRMNANPARPFHSMFSTGAGPINAFVAATWSSLGRGAPRDTVTMPTSLPAADPPTTRPSAPLPTAAPSSRGAVGGAGAPVRGHREAPGAPLDLAQFRRPEAR